MEPAGLPQFFLDCRDDAGVGRLGLCRKHRRKQTVSADEVFVEVPARNISRTLVRGPFVERMGGRSFDVCLSCQGEAHAVFAMSRFVDLGRSSRFLSAEI